MMHWLQDIVSLCGQRCSLTDIGQSYEGRNLPVVKVTQNCPLLIYVYNMCIIFIYMHVFNDTKT